MTGLRYMVTTGSWCEWRQCFDFWSLRFVHVHLHVWTLMKRCFTCSCTAVYMYMYTYTRSCNITSYVLGQRSCAVFCSCSCTCSYIILRIELMFILFHSTGFESVLRVSTVQRGAVVLRQLRVLRHRAASHLHRLAHRPDLSDPRCKWSMDLSTITLIPMAI